MRLQLQCKDQNRKIRIIAILLAAIVFVAILFSVYFIALETDHDCTGEHCPVCMCIRQMESTMHQMGGALPQLVPAFIVVFIAALLPVLCGGFFSQTLVSNKIRMNN